MRLEKNATEEYVLCDTFKTYEAYSLLNLKKYLALYGVTRRSVCTDLCGGHGSKKSAQRGSQR